MKRFFQRHHLTAALSPAAAASRCTQQPERVLLTASLLACSLFFGCQEVKQQDPQALFHFQDSTQTNISFVNRLPEPGEDQLSILDYVDYYNGAGVAAGDIDNDGLVDLFFVSNRGANKLYLNKGKSPQGSFTFEDVSLTAGIEGKADWQTGVTMVDINGDGWLDIYICAVSGFKGLQGANELYINQGPDAQGNISFKEEAAGWGLDFSGFSTQAAFFDYDRDGDLDLYLLNHSVQTPLTINRVTVRELYDPKAGDRLYENQLISNHSPSPQKGPLPFKDVSKQAGIYQSAIGYGLGVVIADLNNDGWDDIYIANDFHEDDYYYLNQGDGTFKESIKEYFGHVSRYSMGCDAADINNDGYPDMMTLDMYPQDEFIQKSSMSEDPFNIFEYKLHFGYFHQYSRNALQLSLAGEKFSDIGVMAGVAATDWSWSTLMADFDGDGHKDIFVGNGVARRPNDLDYLNYASTSQQFMQAGSREVGVGAINMMPEGKVANYLFKGGPDLQFKDISSDWGFKTPSLSNGAVYADLDNDGDLDLILNNLNEAAGIWENRSEQLFAHHFLKVKLAGEQANTFGIGARVYIKHPDGLLFQQLMPTRGFLSSVEPQLTFGLGSQTLIDTLIVIWPNQQAELKTGIRSNSTLLLRQSEARQDAASLQALLFGPSTPLLESAEPPLITAYTHQENPFIDFTREPLMPFMLSGEGPALAVGDVNGDGLDDFYAGGAKGQPGQLYLQQADGRFLATSVASFAADAAHEDVDAHFVDVDGDGSLDLYVVSGGNEATGQAPELLDRLYVNDGTGQFVRATDRLPVMYTNTSCVRPFDFNGDGYPDLFIGGRSIARQYGNVPTSYLLINDGRGSFTDQTDQLAPGLRQVGMVTDARWFDYDGDGSTDLVLVGDWMPVTFFKNTGRGLAEMPQPAGLEQSRGFWQSLALADLDGDGDLDLLVGNLGTNSKLRREGENSRLRLYVKDLDNNGTLEQIMAYQQAGKWYPAASKDELGKQLPHLKKRFTTYRDFAGKTIEEIFTPEELEGARILEVNRFESLYLENLGAGQFRQHFLAPQAQVSSIHAFHVQDLDGDGYPDILLGGNQHRVSTYQGRYDASYGLLLKGNAAGNFTPVQAGSRSGFLFEGEVRAIKPLNTHQGTLLLIARNNLPLQFYSIPVGRQPLIAERER